MVPTKNNFPILTSGMGISISCPAKMDIPGFALRAHPGISIFAGQEMDIPMPEVRMGMLHSLLKDVCMK